MYTYWMYCVWEMQPWQIVNCLCVQLANHCDVAMGVHTTTQMLVMLRRIMPTFQWQGGTPLNHWASLVRTTWRCLHCKTEWWKPFMMCTSPDACKLAIPFFIQQPVIHVLSVAKIDNAFSPVFMYAYCKHPYTQLLILPTFSMVMHGKYKFIQSLYWSCIIHVYTVYYIAYIM